MKTKQDEEQDEKLKEELDKEIHWTIGCSIGLILLGWFFFMCMLIYKSFNG